MPKDPDEAARKLALGDYLRTVREARERSIGDVARAIDRSKSYVCDVEMGRRGGSKMPADIVSTWAAYLDIPVLKIAKLQWPEGMPPSEPTSRRYVSYMRILRNRGRSKRMYAAVKEMRALVSVSGDNLTPAETRALLAKISRNVVEIDNCLAYSR
jgi:transcriptional regulator with XRE-family HTH domain